MKADLIQTWGNDLLVANAARVSMDKHSEVLNTADEKLIHYLAKNKHFSCFEHQGATMRLKVPLFVRSQIHRHRQFSYNEISRRYVKGNLEFYRPEKWRKAAENVKQGSGEETIEELVGEWNPSNIAEEAMIACIDAYDDLIKRGVCPEQARMILPQNLYTQFYMSGNLRAWAHFLNLRLDPHAQKECRDVAQQCLELLSPLFPVSLKALMESEC